MITVEGLGELYRYFFAKRHKSFRYKFAFDKNEELVQGFLEMVHKAYDINTIGYDWLFNYYVFQFSAFDSFDKKERKNFREGIVPVNVFGKTAFDRWQKRNPEFDFTITSNPFPQTYHISKSTILGKLEKQEKNDFDPDKAMRARHLNTDRGFAVCVQYTTLYDPRDTSCKLCKNKNTCMQLLEANYPDLFKQRTGK